MVFPSITLFSVAFTFVKLEWSWKRKAHVLFNSYHNEEGFFGLWHLCRIMSAAWCCGCCHLSESPWCCRWHRGAPSAEADFCTRVYTHSKCIFWCSPAAKIAILQFLCGAAWKQSWCNSGTTVMLFICACAKMLLCSEPSLQAQHTSLGARGCNPSSPSLTRVSSTPGIDPVQM